MRLSDHPSQDQVPDDRLLGFEGGYARVAKSSEWEIKAKNWDAAHESALALLAEKVDSFGALAIAMGSERSRRTKYEKLLGLEKDKAPSKKRKAPAAKPAKKKPAPKKQEPEEEAEAPEPPKKRGKAAAPKAPEGAAEAPRRRQARQGGARGAHGRRRLDQGGEAADPARRTSTSITCRPAAARSCGPCSRWRARPTPSSWPAKGCRGGGAEQPAARHVRRRGAGAALRGARAARPKAPAAKPAAKPPGHVRRRGDEARKSLGAAAQRRACARPRPSRGQAEKRSWPEPKPKARKRRTVVESEDDSEDDEAPPAPPPASPPSDEGDDLYDDENEAEADDDEAEEPPAPPAGGPRFKGGVSSATSEALHRHVAEALEAAAEAPRSPRPSRRGRAASRRRPGRRRPRPRRATSWAPTAACARPTGGTGRTSPRPSARGWRSSAATASRAGSPSRRARPGRRRAAGARSRPSRSRRVAARGGGGRLGRAAAAPTVATSGSPHAAAAGGWGAQPPLTFDEARRVVAGSGGGRRLGAPGQPSPAGFVASRPLAKRMIVVDNNKVKFLIGKGGATHKGIQDRSGAHVSIPNGPDPFDPKRPDPTKPVRTVTIRGPSEERRGRGRARHRIHPEPRPRRSRRCPSRARAPRRR